jgi:hypothetical protein
LLRPAQIEDLLARLDHGAVGDPRDHRRNFAGLDGDHDLVQERHARGGLAQRDHRAAKAEPGEGDQVRVAEALAELGRLVEGCRGGRGVALGQVLEPRWEQQVSLLDAIPLEVVEQAAAPGDPAAGPGDVATVERAEGQPERAPGRSLHAALAQERVMRTRSDLGAVVFPPDQVGRGRQPLQVLRLQRGLPLSCPQPRERLGPCPVLERFPALVERVGRRHPPSPLLDGRIDRARASRSSGSSLAPYRPARSRGRLVHSTGFTHADLRPARWCGPGDGGRWPVTRCRGATVSR